MNFRISPSFWLCIFLIPAVCTASGDNNHTALTQKGFNFLLSCVSGLHQPGEVETTDFHAWIVASLQKHLHTLPDFREQSREQAEQWINEDQSAEIPRMAPETMLALVQAYGEISWTLTLEQREDAHQNAEEALRADPYLMWLRIENPTVDVIKNILAPLNAKDAAWMPPSLALMNTRATLDTSLSERTLALLETTVSMYLAEKLLELKLLPEIKRISAKTWNLAKNLEHALTSRDHLVQAVYGKGAKAFPQSTYEKLKHFLATKNPDVAILGRYIMATDLSGLYYGKLKSEEIHFLTNEAQRIRAEYKFPPETVFNAKFLKMWPEVGPTQNQPYEVILMRHFSKNGAETEQTWRQLTWIIRTAQALRDQKSFDDFIYELLQQDRQAGQYPYLKP